MDKKIQDLGFSAKRGPLGGWFIGGQVSRKAITTEPDHQNQTTKPPNHQTTKPPNHQEIKTVPPL
ncbi:hypothetical protein [Yersinia pseudotuberculosis]|uniref:hypothetical protein n=1 Tax=Yersinia pseudotuberculosis TaxID=633 RepID=UPI0015626698|nr:hypothetical protein [Yersinia pseudotuberculosis]